MVVTAQSPHTLQYEAKSFYFCCAGCKAKFAANPLKYLGGDVPRQTVPPPPSGASTVTVIIYTCPMHPEVRRDRPGACPICGMALEPETPSLDEGENPELVDFRHRFFWTLPLTVVVTVLAMMGERWAWLDAGTRSWIELICTLPILLWAGWPFLIRALHSIRHRSPNMWTLIGLGTSAAFIYSVVATVFPASFPDSLMAMGRIPVYSRPPPSSSR